MRILCICAEFAPLAKVGGLGDVTAGLARYLHRHGHHVMVVLPYYGIMRQQGIGLESSERLAGGVLPSGVAYSVHQLAVAPDGPAICVVDCPELFDGGVYTLGRIEALRFMLLSRAALELAGAIGFHPDIVHCHDWHTAPATVLLKGPYRAVRAFRETYAVLTIHNIGYQGVFPSAILDQADGGELREIFAGGAPAAAPVNFLKVGITHADALTTVSPTHAREIQTPEYGKGLDELLRQRRHRLAGILNGVDYQEWSPESDPLIPSPYSADALAGKRASRSSLLRELDLDAGAHTPIVGVVSRLAEQKGIDLIIEALPALLAQRPFVCAFLGNGEPEFVEGLLQLVQLFPGRVGYVNAQDEALAHRIIAGSDMLLVPSRYEPCGLTQLYAMRYGTVPVVRATGGLADTVEHFNPASGQGTGSVFRDADVGGLVWGLGTALDWFADSASWRRLMRNGMARDFSWDRQGPKYEELFNRLIGDSVDYTRPDITARRR